MPGTVPRGSDKSFALLSRRCSDAAVDRPGVLAAFDEQMRRHPVAGPGVRVETEERLTRTVATDGSWSALVWSDLTEADADEVIAAEVARSTEQLEWKLYAHDRPADLPERLRTAGLIPEPVETLMIAEIADLDLPVRVPDGVRLATVEDDAGSRRCSASTSTCSATSTRAPGPRCGQRSG